MTALEVPSNNFSSISLIAVVRRLCVCTSFGSIKQWVDPESMRAGEEREESEISGETSGTQREFGSERADTLSRTTLDPGWFLFPFPWFERRGPWPWKQRKLTCCNC